MLVPKVVPEDSILVVFIRCHRLRRIFLSVFAKPAAPLSALACPSRNSMMRSRRSKGATRLWKCGSFRRRRNWKFSLLPFIYFIFLHFVSSRWIQPGPLWTSYTGSTSNEHADVLLFSFPSLQKTNGENIKRKLFTFHNVSSGDRPLFSQESVRDFGIYWRGNWIPMQPFVRNHCVVFKARKDVGHYYGHKFLILQTRLF